MSQIAMLEKARGGTDEQVRARVKEWAQGLSERADVRVKAVGVEGVDWSQPRVMMANHQSYLDVLGMFHAIPRIFGFVAKRELYVLPFFSGVMRAIGCIAVDRGKQEKAVTALRRAGEQIRNGAPIAIFPEGTRGPGDCICKLKKGGFYLAQAAQVEILPIGIVGADRLMPRRNTGMWPGEIEVRVGSPIPPPPPNDNAAREATMRRVREELSRLTGLPMRDA
jgi:1-acyl-sn-glycerol-3-phosphate acyltransferase